jgi:uncharacterized protein (TIGR03545 family)
MKTTNGVVMSEQTSAEPSVVQAALMEALAMNVAEQETRPQTPDNSTPEAGAAEASGEEEKKKKKKPPGLGPRWSYLITRGLVVGTIWAFFAYVFDPLLREAAITSGQLAVGAKVEVSGLTTEFFPPRVVVSNVAIANADAPDTNLVEFAEFRGTVSGMALMRGSYVIDEAVVTGLTWNTPRAESGKLDIEPADETPEESDDGSGFQLGEIGNQWAKDLFERAKLEYDPRNLESVRLAQQLEDEWKTDFDDLEARAKTVEAQYKQLEDLIKLARGGNPLKKVEQYRRVAQDGTRLLRQVDGIRKDLKLLPPRAQQDLTDLDAARKRDQIAVRQKIENLTLNGDELSDFLLGPTLNNRIQDALSWLRWADNRADDFASAPKPVRQRGEDVIFPVPNELPRFLIRLIDVSGQGVIGGQHLAIEGTISNVTPDPKKLGKPTIIRMSGRGEADVQMKAIIDRTGETPVNELDLESLLAQPTETSLGDDDTFAITTTAASTRWHVHLKTVGEELSGRIILTQNPVRLTPRLPEKADDSLKRIVAASMQDIDRIEATVELSGTVRKPNIDLATNLGPVIADGIQRGVGSEISAQSDALVARFEADFAERNKSLVGVFNGRYSELTSKLQINESALKNLVPKIAGNTFDPTKLFR